MYKNKNNAGSTNKKPHLLSLALGFAMVTGSTHASAAASYSITDFTNVGTGDFVPSAIKANGQVLGYAGTITTINNVQVHTPQLYDIATGTITNIDALVNGDTFASAIAINTFGQAIGQVLPAASTTGVSPNVFVRNADGTAIDLGMSPGSTAFSAGIGAGINDTGKVFGNKSGTSLCSWRAFVGNINGGALQSLGSIGGGTYDWTQAYSMNASGQIVGRSSPSGACLLSDTWHAFISTPSGLKDLQDPAMPVINPGSGGSAAHAVNDYGFAAGEYPYAFGTATRVFPGGVPIMHAVIWDTVAGTYTDLGKPSLKSSLFSINASGQAVGFESATTTVLGNINGYAVIGDTATGSLTNLNGLVTGLPTGWTLTSAFNISDAGQILASALDAAGTAHYAMLTPSSLPPPVSLPLAPSNLAANATSSTQINLSWSDNATNETTQYLERCQGVGCTNFTQIASLAANVTSYSDTALAPATSYSYRISAYGSTGNSAYSNTATASTSSVAIPVVTIPIAPTSLSSSAISRSKVVLSWVDNATDEKNYLIERCKGLNCTSFSKIATVGANVVSYTGSNLSRNTNYSYRVRAANTVGKSAYSNILKVKTLP